MGRPTDPAAPRKRSARPPTGPTARPRGPHGATPDGSHDAAGATPNGSGFLASSGAGYGLRGIAERVALLGGHVEAGPTTEGWRVEAVVPLASDAEAQPIQGVHGVQA